MEQTDIVLKNISKSYGAKKVLSDINFTFLSGHTYCLTAPSGTGKTTLLKILMGLEKPDAGSIRGIKPQKVSVVFQEDRLLENLNALQNIRFVTGNLYSKAELGKRMADLLPNDCINQPVREFSGGMKRRLSILRALLVPSEYILMDEPFSGLDRDCRKKAVNLIQKYTRNKLLIIATHDPEEIALPNAEAIHLLP